MLEFEALVMKNPDNQSDEVRECSKDPLGVEDDKIFSMGTKDQDKTIYPASIYSCHECQRTFKYFYQLTNHISVKHKKVKLELHKCDFCEATRKIYEIMKRHVETIHEGIRKFKCDLCDKAYGKKAILKEHIESIHSGKRFQCENCEKSFKNAHGLYTQAAGEAFDSPKKFPETILCIF